MNRPSPSNAYSACLRRWTGFFLLSLALAWTLPAVAERPQSPAPKRKAPPVSMPVDAEGHPLDRIVAIVEDDAIMLSELMERVDVIKRQLAAKAPGQFRPEDLQDKQILKQVLDRMILDRLQLQQAERLGIRVDDLTLNEAMLQLARERNTTLEAFRDQLVSEGINYVHFREQVRNEIIMSRLHKRQVDSTVQVSEQEIDDLITSRNETIGRDIDYRLSHIMVSIPEGATPEQIQISRKKAEALEERAAKGEDFAKLAVSESEGENALDGGDLGWRKIDELPSIFAHSVSLMKMGDVSKVIRSPSGFHIIKLTDRRGEQGKLVEQTHVRHILVKPNALVTEDEARKQLTALRARIVGGDSFADLAKAHSEDPGSASEGGDLGWVNPGELASQFEEVMNGLKPDEVSEPFKTQFGWHILQVLGRRQQDETQQLMRNQARDLIRSRKADEELNLWLRRLRDENYVEYRLDPGSQG